MDFEKCDIIIWHPGSAWLILQMYLSPYYGQEIQGIKFEIARIMTDTRQEDNQASGSH